MNGLTEKNAVAPADASHSQIWPVHKFFCGPKACPLVWPDFTTAEADAAWKQRTWCDDSSEAIHYEDRIPITSAFKQIIGIEENELQVPLTFRSPTTLPRLTDAAPSTERSAVTHRQRRSDADSRRPPTSPR